MLKYRLPAILLAFCLTIALFYLMKFLIHTDKPLLNKAISTRLLDFLPQIKEKKVDYEKKRVRPPPPAKPPPPIERIVADKITVSQDNMSFNLRPNIAIKTNAMAFSGDGEFLPILISQPVYPKRALNKGIEGYVVLEFTVTAQGTVENPVIIEEKPIGFFGRAATKAALKYKYKPKVEGGIPVATPNVRYKITFKIAEK